MERHEIIWLVITIVGCVVILWVSFIVIHLKKPIIKEPYYNKNKIVIVINSCVNYIDKTRDIIIPSLLESSVPSTDIHIVIGESLSTYDETIDGISYHYRPMINIDNNGLIWASQEEPFQNSQYEWIFYLHDTCYVHTDFWKNLQMIANDRVYDSRYVCVKLLDVYSMGMGFYSIDWISINSYIKSLANYNIENKLKIKEDGEDLVFYYAGDSCLSLGLQSVLIQDDVRHIYKTGKQRILEYIEMPGIYKAKANYGKSPWSTELFTQ